MNKKINMGRISSLSAVPLLAVIASLLSVGVAHAAIVTTLDLGASGAQVTELQQFLSADAAIYPSGRITGYFGALTQAGVQRFQVAQGIVSSGSPLTTGYGRVGPATMARINSLMGAGVQTSWDAVPFLSASTVQVTGSSATLRFTTNEATIGEIYYDTFPLQSAESTGPRQKPYVSGTLVTVAGGYQLSHTVTISGLQSNTIYNFLTRVIDSVGNLSMTLPSIFRTN